MQTNQTLENLKGNVHLCLRKRGVGREVLKIWHVFADSTILNNRCIIQFGAWCKWEDHLLVISCGRHKWVTSKTKIILKKIFLESNRVRSACLSFKVAFLFTVAMLL